MSTVRPGEFVRIGLGGWTPNRNAVGLLERIISDGHGSQIAVVELAPLDSARGRSVTQEFIKNLEPSIHQRLRAHRGLFTRIRRALRCGWLGLCSGWKWGGL